MAITTHPRRHLTILALTAALASGGLATHAHAQEQGAAEPTAHLMLVTTNPAPRTVFSAVLPFDTMQACRDGAMNLRLEAVINIVITDMTCVSSSGEVEPQ